MVNEEIDIHLAFVGVGSMLETLVRGALAKGTDPGKLHLAHRREDRRAELEELGVSVYSENDDALRAAELVVLGVRPQQMGELVSSLKSVITTEQSVISIAAGLDLSWLHRNLPSGVPVVRATPPPTAAVQKGVALLTASKSVPANHLRCTEILFAGAAGRVQWIEDQYHDALTSVAQAATPYLGLVIRALIDTSVELAIPVEMSSRLVKESFVAAAEMIAASQRSIDDIVSSAATPGGLTEAALNEMNDHGVPQGLRAGALAMQARAAEMRGELI